MEDEQNEELELRVKERLKAALEIPAEFAKMNKETDDKERQMIMYMVEDVLNYLEDWRENSMVIQKYHQHCFGKSFKCSRER